MPMPTPNEGESEQEFVSRCMGNDTALEDFPDQAQRAAVCFSIFRRDRGEEGLLALSGPEQSACGANAPRCPTRMGAWYNLEAADDRVLVRIYDEIVDGGETALFGAGVAASAFVADLTPHRGTPLEVHIHSPGGSIFGALAMYNALRAHDAPVHVVVDGLAASAASLVAMAGTTVTMAPHSMLMIHEAQGLTVGDADAHHKQAAVLDQLSDNIARIYAARADRRVNWRAKMREETWYNDRDAVRAGLADRVDASLHVASNVFDLSHFKNAPAVIAWQDARDAVPTKRDLERALRDAGLSPGRAKAFISGGYAAISARDEPETGADEPETVLPVAQTASWDEELPTPAQMQTFFLEHGLAHVAASG